jgi:hypothetical protein
MAMCSVLYRVGFSQPLAQYCAGQAGQDLLVGALRLDAGSYFLAVSQDRTRDENGQAPPIHENVSDPYRVTVDLASVSPGDEIEPNDSASAAQPMLVGGQIDGTLAWAGDEDVFCLPASVSSDIRWEVSDQPRPDGTVLEATPTTAGTAQPLVRVHPSGASAFGRPRLPADVTSPWLSPPVAAEEGARCLRLRLTSDPWSDQVRGARADGTVYRVRVLSSDGQPDDASPASAPSAASGSAAQDHRPSGVKKRVATPPDAKSSKGPSSVEPPPPSGGPGPVPPPAQDSESDGASASDGASGSDRDAQGD